MVPIMRQGPLDSVVAQVNGTPIFAQCVAQQSQSAGVSVPKALQQCIEFELLAIEADRRGFATHPEVLDVRKRESVRALIHQEFVAQFSTPDDVPMHYVRKSYEKTKEQFNHPEIRFTVHVRAVVDKKVPRENAIDLAAKDLAQNIYNALKDRSFATKEEFYHAALLAAGQQPIEKGRPFNFPRHGKAVEPFAKAAFLIPRIGQVSPPVRTPWGWDVILLIHILPPRETTFEQAAAEIRPAIFAITRRHSFQQWAKNLESKYTIQTHSQPLKHLVALDPNALSSLPANTP